jgi:capsular exopolysaccharide synthesis family protein
MSKNEDTMLITLTSTVSGEGKTTVATNLSAIISLTGKKTIVLNMDMRKPMLHTKFSLPNNQGMSTLLSGKADINDVIQETDYENLDIISSGPIPPNPSELIGGENMLKVIESLKSEYDVIIFDTPPIGLVTDAMVLMRMSDVTLYVLRSEYSKKTYLVDIQRMMDEHQVKGFTLLLNGIKANKEGYGYGYGYGHGYYEEN